jgi:Flp pilus assembly protein TadG
MDYRGSLTYLRAANSVHLAKLRAAFRAGDRGASAVELAFITAGLLIVAGLIYAAIQVFVTNQSTKITGNTGP